VRGTESWASETEADGRAAVFSNVRCVTVSGAGHWVHHDRTAEFLRIVRAFLAEPNGRAR
jgi:pimeloyl-ACP methyl ester carboxylesterase